MSGFTANVADPTREKHALLVIKPRLRWTGWALESGHIWKSYFPHGYVTRTWREYTVPATPVASIAAVTSAGLFFYDTATKFIYVYNDDPNLVLTPLDPDSNDYPGMTVEFEIHVSDQAFIGPRDPASAGSFKVNWIPALKEIPVAQSGSKDSIYGFLPMNSSVLTLLNHDGWMNEILYAASFYRCGIKAYILASEDLTEGAVFAEVKQVFSGFGIGMRSKWPIVQINCADVISYFDKQVVLRRASSLTGTYPNLDPAASSGQSPWFIPRIWGIIERFLPINLDYSATPSTSNNRIWLTHQKDTGTDGTGLDGTLTYTVNSAGTNNATRSTFLTTPKVRIGDTMVIQRSGVNKFALITAVNAAGKTVDHDAITGSASPGDTAIRYFIGRVDIQDQNGNVYNLKAVRDYTVLIDNVKNIRGFTLVNNVESGFLNTPFDPANWKISCILYGRVGGDSYGNADPVGSVVDNGGVSARSINAIFHLLSDALFDVLNDLSTSEFQAVETLSYAIGLAIPSTRSTVDAPTYRDAINQLLGSNMYKISMVQESAAIRLGITQVGPFSGGGDYEAGELNHKDLSFEHDYLNAFSDVRLTYNKKEVIHDTESTDVSVVTSQSDAAEDLHLIKNTFAFDSLIANLSEAQELADRYGFLLGERRGFWTMDFELPYIDKSNIGSTYLLSRQQMPGAPYVEGTQNQQELIVSEVNKNSRSVSITLEDQKGVQDNSANW